MAATVVTLKMRMIPTVYAMASSSPESYFVKKTIASHQTVIFSKSYCAYCEAAKAVFKDLHKVPYVVELDQRDDGSAIQDALSAFVGRHTVPQVLIDGKYISGSDDSIEAYKSGELGKLLGIKE
ncbi:glutaredoxin-C4-like [Benincasa hispida]|uniref:glutaredoxin-C4-like n=1 Tax=Benincasa hispida TaxID=102211 RepID=UPI0019006766|nr:glutaredoxin-C4-like [Benincasa hispida]